MSFFLEDLFRGQDIPKNISVKRAKQIQNSREYLNQFYHLYNLAMAVFSWKNLPETCNARALEHQLLIRGQALLAQPTGLGYINLGSTTTGYWNVYGEPVQAYGYGVNGFNALFDLYIKGGSPATTQAWLSINLEQNSTLSVPSDFTQGTAVWCRDNAATYPYLNYLMSAAIRMADMQRAADVAANNLKQPILITCEESLINSSKEAMKQRDENMPAIMSSGKLNLDQIKIWDVKSNPENLRGIWEHYERIENQVARHLGIRTATQVDKKERLLVDEINAGQDITEFNLEKRLHYRKDFCEAVNEHFGLNIDVELKVTQAAEMTAELDKIALGGDNNVEE